MNTEIIIGIIFGSIILLSVGLKFWRMRKQIMNMYINGFNFACAKAGLPTLKFEEEENEEEGEDE